MVGGRAKRAETDRETLSQTTRAPPEFRTPSTSDGPVSRRGCLRLSLRGRSGALEDPAATEPLAVWAAAAEGTYVGGVALALHCSFVLIGGAHRRTNPSESLFAVLGSSR